MAQQKNRLPDCESHPNSHISMVCLFPNCEKPLFCGQCMRGGINVTHQQHMHFVFSTQELIEMDSDCQQDIYESFVGRKQTSSQGAIDDLFRELEAEIAEKLCAAKKEILEKLEKRNSAIESIKDSLKEFSSTLKAGENENERGAEVQEMRGIISELGKKIAATNEMSTRVSFCEDDFRRVKRDILKLVEKDLFEQSVVEGTKELLIVRQEKSRKQDPPQNQQQNNYQNDFKLLQWNELDKPLLFFLQFELAKIQEQEKFYLRSFKKPSASIFISSNFFSSETYLCEFQFDLEAIKYCAPNPIDVPQNHSQSLQQQSIQPNNLQSGLFGSSQQTGGMFGNTQTQVQTGLFGSFQQKGGMFGNAQTQVQTGLFGSSQQPGEMFGFIQPQASTGLFGQQPGGMFGFIQPQGPTGLFGSSQHEGGQFAPTQSQQMSIRQFGSEQVQVLNGDFQNAQSQGGIFQSIQSQGGIFQSIQSQGGLFGSIESQGNLFSNQSSGGLFGNLLAVPNKSKEKKQDTSPYEDIEMMTKNMFEARSEKRSENEQPNVYSSVNMIIQIFQVDERGVQTLLFSSDSFNQDSQTQVKFPQKVLLKISPNEFTCTGSWKAVFSRKETQKNGSRKIDTPTFSIKALIQMVNTSGCQTFYSNQNPVLQAVTTLQPVLSVNYIRKL